MFDLLAETRAALVLVTHDAGPGSPRRPHRGHGRRAARRRPHARMRLALTLRAPGAAVGRGAASACSWPAWRWGVAALAAAGLDGRTPSAHGLATQARTILGGDLAASVAGAAASPPAELRRLRRTWGAPPTAFVVRAMAQAPDRRRVGWRRSRGVDRQPTRSQARSACSGVRDTSPQARGRPRRSGPGAAVEQPH